MRNPFRSEAEAFSFVLVCVALFAAVAVAGIFAATCRPSAPWNSSSRARS